MKEMLKRWRQLTRQLAVHEGRSSCVEPGRSPATKRSGEGVAEGFIVLLFSKRLIGRVEMNV